MNSKDSFKALVSIIQEKIEELGSNNPSNEVEKLIKSNAIIEVIIFVIEAG